MAIRNLQEFHEHPTFSDNPGLLRVLQVFDGISNHPRPSKGEEAVRAHLMELAKEQGWNVEQDSTGNIAIQVPASEGKEGVTPVILQGHMDIVVTPSDRNLPRTAEIVDQGQDGGEKGLWMQTEGRKMTLGSDNGIGVSLAVAAMMDPELSHGPVTILITVNEETGMTGAKGLDPRLLPSTGLLINLDSEEGPADICIGCAGSADIVAKFPVGDRETLPEGYECIEINLVGFPGGHSGVAIHEANGNAIGSLATLLQRMQKEVPNLRLVAIDGGTARNAIPSTAKATVAVPSASVSALQEIADTFVTELKLGEAAEDPSVTGVLSAKKAKDVTVEISERSQDVIKGFALEFQNRILQALTDTLTGPFASAELPNVGTLVTLSNNLGTIATNDTEIEVVSMARGANIDELRAKIAEIAGIYESLGGNVTANEPSAGWLEDPETSPAVALAVQAVQKVMGISRFLAYHAGLESGIVIGKGENLSAVAIGPLILEAHTPRERVSLESVAAEVAVLRELLQMVV